MGKRHSETTKHDQPPTVTTEDELAKLKTERADLIDHLQRLQAEFENYRKRTDAEKARLNEGASDRLLTDLLPIIDHLDLAIEHGENHQELLTGVTLVRDQIHRLLADHGVTPLSTDGAFDPKRHEAITTEATDKHEPNQITKTFQRGYVRGERVLRPARVSVAKEREPQ